MTFFLLHRPPKINMYSVSVRVECGRRAVHDPEFGPPEWPMGMRYYQVSFQTHFYIQINSVPNFKLHVVDIFLFVCCFWSSDRQYWRQEASHPQAIFFISDEMVNNFFLLWFRFVRSVISFRDSFLTVRYSLSDMRHYL